MQEFGLGSISITPRELTPLISEDQPPTMISNIKKFFTVKKTDDEHHGDFFATMRTLRTLFKPGLDTGLVEVMDLVAG